MVGFLLAYNSSSDLILMVSLPFQANLNGQCSLREDSSDEILLVVDGSSVSARDTYIIASAKHCKKFSHSMYNEIKRLSTSIGLCVPCRGRTEIVKQEGKGHHR